MNSGLGECWIQIASGELGDAVYWEPGYEVLEKARYLLCLTEEIDVTDSELEQMLEGLPRLQPIEDMEFPPLYNEDAFGEIDGFLDIIGEPAVERPGQTFNSIRLYIDEDDRSELLAQFQELVKRLSEHPLLAEYA